MRLSLFLASTSVLALFIGNAHAAPITFSYTGSIVYFTVPTTGSYTIEALGASGGTANVKDGGDAAAGGLGAEIEATFSLTEGEVLSIAVGGRGQDNPKTIGPGGGGGGTFVLSPSDTPLLIAGGGGGGAVGGNTSDTRGVSASTESASKGNAAGLEKIDGGAAGSNGSGGDGGPTKSGDGYGGGGGGGLSGAGGCGGTCANAGAGGQDFFAGLAGGAGGASNGGAGGFGGGGGGGYLGGGGGGGGYSGGGGGAANQNEGGGGGNGASFSAGTDTAFLGARATAPNGSDGFVTITESDLSVTSVPEPGSLALLGVGALGVFSVRRLRRNSDET